MRKAFPLHLVLIQEEVGSRVWLSPQGWRLKRPGTDLILFRAVAFLHSDFLSYLRSFLNRMGGVPIRLEFTMTVVRFGHLRC